MYLQTQTDFPFKSGSFPLKPWFSELPGTWRNWEKNKQKNIGLCAFSIVGLHHLGFHTLKYPPGILGTNISPPNVKKKQSPFLGCTWLATKLSTLRVSDSPATSPQNARREPCIWQPAQMHGAILCNAIGGCWFFALILVSSCLGNKAPTRPRQLKNKFEGTFFFFFGGGDGRKVQQKVGFQGHCTSLRELDHWISLDFVQVMFLYMVYHGRWAPLPRWVSLKFRILFHESHDYVMIMGER